MTTQTNRTRRATALFLLCLALSLSLRSCTDRKAEDRAPGDTARDGTVVLSENANIASRLRFSTVAERDFAAERTAAGTIRAIPTAYAEIAPPFAGRVLKSHVRLGQKVNAGSPLFDISSPDYFNAQKEYADAGQEYRQAERNLKRQQDLLANGVAAQRELEEAEMEHAIRKSALASASVALRVFGVDPEKAVLGWPLTVTSPIRGEVLSHNIVIGQYLREDAEPLAVVADLSSVWIAAQVKEKDIPSVRKMDEAEVQVSAYPDKVFKGKIHHTGDIVSEETRSVEVLVECENPTRDLKPGMYATVLFKDRRESVLLVPSGAVFQQEDGQFVFVKTGEGRFEKRTIGTAGTSNGNIIVASGLRAGETVVSEGGFLISY